jgi:hypothetical protein
MSTLSATVGNAATFRLERAFPSKSSTAGGLGSTRRKEWRASARAM